MVNNSPEENRLKFVKIEFCLGLCFDTTNPDTLVHREADIILL